MDYNFITIEGNIGSGKTSLARKIADQFGGKLILEEFAENPFLPLFYQDQEKYSFPLELSFLAERYQQLKDNISNQDLFASFTISDYIFYKSLIFARTNLGKEEYELYTKLFNIIYSALPKPELLVYLYVEIPQLLRNIKKRGRSYEQEIDPGYLQNIQDNYFEFFRQQQNMSILVLDTTHIDFVGKPEDYQKIITLIQRRYPVGVTRILL